MADFNEAIDIILEGEGGWSDNPADAGGATNRGITFRLFKQYAAELGVQATKDSLKALTEQQAKYIYKKEFWNKMRGDEIKDQQVATQVFDFYVNAGVPALKKLQEEIGVESDGVIGPVTIAILNKANPEIVFDGYRDARELFYRAIVDKKPSQSVFMKGWLNRVHKFVYKKPHLPT